MKCDKNYYVCITATTEFLLLLSLAHNHMQLIVLIFKGISV